MTLMGDRFLPCRGKQMSEGVTLSTAWRHPDTNPGPQRRQACMFSLHHSDNPGQWKSTCRCWRKGAKPSMISQGQSPEARKLWRKYKKDFAIVLVPTDAEIYNLYFSRVLDCFWMHASDKMHAGDRSLIQLTAKSWKVVEPYHFWWACL